jgi:hypothetical protein
MVVKNDNDGDYDDDDDDILTPWNRVFLQKITAPQLRNKFPAFHGDRRFITGLTRTH